MVLNSLQDVNTKVVTFINITMKTYPNNIQFLHDAKTPRDSFPLAKIDVGCSKKKIKTENI